MNKNTITSTLVVTDAGNVDLEIPTEEADDKQLYDSINEFAVNEIGADLVELAQQEEGIALLNQEIQRQNGINVSRPGTAVREVLEIRDTRKL